MTKDLNPQQYKQMMNYLTRPEQKKREFAKAVKRARFLALLPYVAN